MLELNKVKALDELFFEHGVEEFQFTQGLKKHKIGGDDIKSNTSQLKPE